MHHTNRTFRDATVPLDAAAYYGCTFESCVLGFGALGREQVEATFDEIRSGSRV